MTTPAISIAYPSSHDIVASIRVQTPLWGVDRTVAKAHKCQGIWHVRRANACEYYARVRTEREAVEILRMLAAQVSA